jgi:hypothetical protein
MRMAEQRMEAMSKMNAVKLDTANTNAQVARANLDILKMKKEQAGLGQGTVQVSPSKAGEVIDIQGVPHQVTPGPGGRSGTLQPLTGDALGRYQAKQELGQRREHVDLRLKEMRADQPQSLSNLIGIRRDMQSRLDDFSLSDEEIAEVRANISELDEMINARAGLEGRKQDEGLGPIAGVEKLVTDVFEQYKGLARNAVKASGVEPGRIKADMSNWVAEQMRADPSGDPEELAVDYMNFLTERFRGTRR